jgi:hypothetical protein
MALIQNVILFGIQAVAGVVTRRPHNAESAGRNLFFSGVVAVAGISSLDHVRGRVQKQLYALAYPLVVYDS